MEVCAERGRAAAMLRKGYVHLRVNDTRQKNKDRNGKKKKRHSDFCASQDSFMFTDGWRSSECDQD